MKVYVVINDEYRTYTFEGAFTTREKAEAYLKDNNTADDDWYVTEYVLNEGEYYER